MYGHDAADAHPRPRRTGGGGGEARLLHEDLLVKVGRGSLGGRRPVDELGLLLLLNKCGQSQAYIRLIFKISYPVVCVMICD